jgi:microcystin-dependent protein
MVSPYLSEIRIMSFNFAPKGWAQCNGQTMPINQNQALFALLGTTYGGNGTTTFALPDLRGRVPIHMGAGFTQGERGGEYTHTLITSEMAAHNHSASGHAAQANQPTVKANTDGLAQGFAVGQGGSAVNIYGNAGNTLTLAAGSVSKTGGDQPHDNTQPYLALNFCISLTGAFPTQN